MAAAAPPAPLTLSDAQIERYSRQIVLPEIGGNGQSRLLATSVLVLGRGALAETTALYLAGAGIGRITLDAANAALAAALMDLNSDVAVTAAAGADATACDIVVACDADPDAIATASARGARLIAGGVGGAGGWLALSSRGNDCAVCAALDHAETQDAETDVELAGVAAGAVGSLMALEVVKLCLGQGTALSGERRIDVRSATMSEQPIARHPRCAVCATLER